MISPVSGLALDNQVSTIKELAACYGSWEGIRTNHVVSTSGSFFDSLGSSRGLSTPEDLALMLTLRKSCDLLIVDAATARSENYKKPAFGQLAIVSITGNFSAIPVAKQDEGVILFSPESTQGTDEKKQKHVIISANSPFHSLLDWAKGRGMKSLLLEAGPTLTKICFAEKLVSESALTITPRLSGPDQEEFRHPLSREARLISVAESTTASFTLWRN